VGSSGVQLIPVNHLGHRQLGRGRRQVVLVLLVVITEQIYFIFLGEHAHSFISLVHGSYIVVFVLQQSFLRLLLPEVVLLLQQVQDLPIHWDLVHSNDDSLTKSSVKALVALYWHLIEPSMFPDITDGVPPVRISAENTLEQVSSFFRHKLGNLEISLQDLLIQLGCVRVFKGQVSTDECEHDDSTTPDIHIGAQVPLARNHLRSSIAGTSTCSLQSLSGLISIGQTKVNYLDVLVLVKQEVLWLQVSVHDVQSVQVLHSIHDLLEEPACLVLLDSSLSHDVVEQLSSTSILHDQVEFLLGFNDLKELDDVGMSDLLQNVDFPSYSLHIGHV
jgi:hypothetical protein